MNRRRWIVVSVVVLAVVACVAALVVRSREPEASVLVLCGGSMRRPMEAIAARYEAATGVKVAISYGGSGDLYAQLTQTGKGDVYVCHDPFMAQGVREKVIDRWAPVARLELVIVTAKDNTSINGFRDLARPGVRLGIGDRVHSTGGQIVKAILARIPEGEAIERNVTVEIHSNQNRCEQVLLGTLDATIVWNAVAEAYRDRLRIVPMPIETPQVGGGVARAAADAAGGPEVLRVDAVTSATYGQSDLSNVQVTAGLTRKAAADNPAAGEFYDFVLKHAAVFEQMGFSPVAGD